MIEGETETQEAHSDGLFFSAPVLLEEQKTLTPEMRLSVSVLEDGINEFLGSRGGSERFLAASEWLKDTDDTWVFSFEAICDRIGFSSTKVRKRTHEMRAEGIKRLSGYARIIGRPANVAA